MVYLYTLDSHDCFGRFASRDTAHAWALKTGKTSYQLLNKPPHVSTVVLNPYDPDMIEAFRNKTPHPLFEIWCPDEVAECLEGVGEDLYRKLWTCVDFYTKPSPEVSEEPVHGMDCLADHWHRLTSDEQVALNALAEKHERQFDAIPGADRHVDPELKG